jgi:hypothetical protein
MASKVSYINANSMLSIEFCTLGQMVNRSGRNPILETANP